MGAGCTFETRAKRPQVERSGQSSFIVGRIQKRHDERRRLAGAKPQGGMAIQGGLRTTDSLRPQICQGEPFWVFRPGKALFVFGRLTGRELSSSIAFSPPSKEKAVAGVTAPMRRLDPNNCVLPQIAG
jgi:hypothetical protein